MSYGLTAYHLAHHNGASWYSIEVHTIDGEVSN